MTDFKELVKELHSKRDGVIDLRTESKRVSKASTDAYNAFCEAASAIVDDGRMLDGLIFNKIIKRLSYGGLYWQADVPPKGSGARMLMNELFNAHEAQSHRDEPVRNLHIVLNDDPDASTWISTTTGYHTITLIRNETNDDIAKIRLSVEMYGSGSNLSLHSFISLKAYCRRYGFEFDPAGLLEPYAEAQRYMNKLYHDAEDRKSTEYMTHKQIIERYPAMLGFLSMAGVLIDTPDNIIEMCKELSDKPYEKKKEEEVKDEHSPDDITD